MKALLGKKVGMTRIFGENGDHVPVTVVEAGPCYVTQIKSKDVDGYNALQLGFSEANPKRVTKPLQGHFEKANAKPLQYLKEFKFDSVEGFELGQALTVEQFVVGELVAVTGTSKGRGNAGVMKRHHFSGANKTHGQKDRWRAPGSIGNASDPSRVFPGKRMAGRMGGDRVHVKNLDVVKIDAEKNLLFIRGSVPGARNGLIEIVFNG